MTPETVSLQTIDGVTLEADVIRADEDTPRAFVVIAHPHPQHGGDRTNNVVRAMQSAAFRLGCHSVAPDFRGAGGSMGVHDDGVSERLDLAAACELAAFVADDVPVVMAGYSFGAAVSLNVVHSSIAAWLAIAPPAVMLREVPVAAGSHLPKRIVMPEHDQFTTMEQINTTVAGWKNTSVSIAAGADHFFATGADDVCRKALENLLRDL